MLEVGVGKNVNDDSNLEEAELSEERGHASLNQCVNNNVQF
jgi:hypothetical protein